MIHEGKRKDKLDFIKIKKTLLLCERQFKKMKTGYRLCKNICKLHIQQIKCIQNIRRTLKTQQSKNNTFKNRSEDLNKHMQKEIQ